MATTTPKAATPKRRTKPQARNGRARKSPQPESSLNVQRPLWITVGAFALAADALQDFLDEALKRGKKLESRARSELKKGSQETTKARKTVQKRARKVAKETNRIADRVLHALEIPTHADIKTLEKKVDALAKKVA